MNLQLLRGRDLRPPSRSARVLPAVVPESQTQAELAQLPSPRKTVLRFPVGAATRAFYRHFYPDTTTAEWNDWRWQLRTRVRTLEELQRVFVLSEDERKAVAGHTGPLPVGITPY